MAALPRLPFSLQYCSSEDPDYPAQALTDSHAAGGRGWQTARFCDYPQELLLRFETSVHLRKVEFLSHQSKIATKIEFFTALVPENQFGQPVNPENLTFKRLGYCSLDSNERSKYEARELKSVYVDVPAQYLKIVFHKCHANKFNILNQVGLIALKCMGEVLSPEALPAPAPESQHARGVAKAPPPAQPQQPQGGGGGGFQRSDSMPQAGGLGLGPDPDAAQAAMDEQKYDPKTLERIRSLTVAKQRAVEAEDYEEAKRLKEALARLRQRGLLLRDLEERKRLAVQNEDYDAAKALKVEIERLRQSIDRPPAQQHEDEPGFPDQRPPPQHQADPYQGQAGGPDAYQGPVGGFSGGIPPPQAYSMQDEGMDNYDIPVSNGFPQPDEGPLNHSTTPEPTPAARTGASKSRLLQRGTKGSQSFGHSQEVPMADPGASPPIHGGQLGRMVHSGGFNGHQGPTGQPDWSAQPGPTPYDMSPSHDPDDSPGQYDNANHPLSGVPNFEDLGEPDAFPAAEKDAGELSRLFGEYLTRCLYSKAWNLRDAALQKIVLELNAGTYADEQAGRLLDGLSLVLQRGLPDKHVQVFLSCGPLLHWMCREIFKSNEVRRSQVHMALEPIMSMLADRLGDTNGRVDKMSRDIHLEFSHSSVVGAQFAAAYVQRQPKKKAVPPRVYAARLQLLTSIIEEAGTNLDQPDGLDVGPVLKIAMEWFNNSNADVREGAVRLVGACEYRAGLDRVEPYLSKLKPVQRELFDAEFERRAGEGPPPPVDQFHSKPKGKPGPAARQEAPQAAYGYQDHVSPDEPEETVCQFCLRQDPSLTPENIDVHYWRECPMLIQCDCCAQVIEISTLFEHLTEECEKEAEARERAAEMDATSCPLCGQGLGPAEDEDWRDHLVRQGCPNNPRDAHRHL
mmetsp:Transcript_10008/g.21825  ORF Transcript_10008/g.21825 Transcript_10008/m.21825 type:complete len:907 (+) Transcript_10008:13-2733(+)